MNGVHDLGGMDGFGPVEPEPDEPVFHAEWEKRVFALDQAMGRHLPTTIEAWRHMREQIDPVTYLTASYYEHWLMVLERQIFEQGLVGPEELKKRMAELAKETR